MIALPYRSNQSSNGSVSAFVPEPLDKADFAMTSCNASEAGTNSVSSNSAEPGAGVNTSRRRGTRGVNALADERGKAWVSLTYPKYPHICTHSAGIKGSHAWKHFNADCSSLGAGCGRGLEMDVLTA